MSFQICGTRVRVSFFFFGALALFLALDKSGLGWLMAVAAALHEGGHLAVMALIGDPVRELAFTPFGVRILRGGETGGRTAVYLAGPAVNLFCAAAAFFPGRSHPVCLAFSAVNLVMGAFHLMPIACLDGGNALRSLLEGRLSGRKLMLLSDAASFLALVPLTLLGVRLLLNGGNFTLLAVCGYLAALVVLGRA